MNAAVAGLLARGSLAASGWRLGLTLACIALGVALAAAVHTVHSSALAEIDRAARALAGRADVEIRGPRNGFDDALFVAIAARPEVAVASPVVEVDAPVAGGDAVVRVVGIDAFRASRLQPAFLAGNASTSLAGNASLLDPANAWLSAGVATSLGVREGGELRLLAGNGIRAYRVAGVLGALEAGDAVLVDIAAAQAHFGRAGRLDRIDVRLREGVDAAAFRASLALPPGVVASAAASLSGRAASITRAYRVNLDALSLVALATGAFLVFSTLALQAARRRQELALLRALGVTRRGLAGLLALEGALLGAVGAVAGIALGLAGSRALLARTGADLGAGYFGGQAAAFAPDPAALAGIAALAVALSAGGAAIVARAVGRIPVADALRDRTVDLPQPRGGALPALALFAAGLPLLALPAWNGLPLGGYAAIGLWLAASVAAVPAACRTLLRGPGAGASPVVSLALAQVRHLPGHLAASVAGIVVSASLCVAMAIMVHSFRLSLTEWLGGVVRADLYVSAAQGGSTTYFTREEQARVAALPGVASVEALRFDRLVLPPEPSPLTLVARPVDARVLQGFQAEPAGMPVRGAEIPVWMSEAARDLHGWRVGERVELPVAGRAVPVRIAGLIRDYARTWGAVLMPLEDYRALTGDTLANDFSIHLAPGADAAQVQRAVRATLPHAGLAIEDGTQLRRRSLAIFDRSFAVTYALEAIAIAIGLAGVTSSFAALAWSRRREFGVLRFLGLTRREILRMLAAEGAAAGALGALLGLVSGIAMSVVLVRVVNRQSFHWSIDIHWPLAALAVLAAGVVLACAAGARASGALAVRREAILAVKDDA